MKTLLTELLLLLSVLPLVMFCQTSLSTDYPYLFNVQLNCQVRLDISTNLFYYDYTVINSKNNRGDIWIVEIDISRTPQSISYDTLGLKFRSKLIEHYFRTYFPQLANSIVPASVSKLPNLYWVASPIGRLTMHISIDTLLPRPGDIILGIQMMSKALPGIRKFKVLPDFNVSEFLPSIEDMNSTMTMEQMDSIRNSTNYYGWTVGPYAPAAIFNPNTILDTLTSYIHQSHTLGWINNTRDDDCEDDEKAEDGIVKNLDKRLEKVRDFIVKKKYDKAQQQIEKFLNKVEKLWNRQQKEEAKNKKNPKIIFTSEVYALLKYNGEYLSQQLPGKK